MSDHDDAIHVLSARDRALIAWGLATGMRVGEVAEANLDDLFPVCFDSGADAATMSALDELL